MLSKLHADSVATVYLTLAAAAVFALLVASRHGSLTKLVISSLAFIEPYNSLR